MSETCLLYRAVLSRFEQEVMSMGIPSISSAEEEQSFYIFLQLQVEVQRRAHRHFTLKLSTTVLFLARRGLSYYPP